eukprot:SM000173S02997  [mRNA]  locus=s173:65237:66721:- [translate_table: standard]
MRDAGGVPLCLGLRTSAPGTLVAREEEGGEQQRTVSEFQYACVGYSVYNTTRRAAAPTRVPGSPPVDASELPLCTGLELLVDRKLDDDRHRVPVPQSAEVDPSTSSSEQESKPLILPRPASPPMRPALPGIGNVSRDEFVRSAGLIANKMASNLSRAAGAVKAGIEHMYSDRGEPK